MKKLTLLFILLTVFLITACSGDSDQEVKGQEENIESSEENNDEDNSEVENTGDQEEEIVVETTKTDSEAEAQEDVLIETYKEEARKLISRINESYAAETEEEYRQIFEDVFYKVGDRVDNLIENDFFTPGFYSDPVSEFEDENVIISEETEDAFTYSAIVHLSANVRETGESESVSESFVVYVEKVEENGFQAISMDSQFVD